MSSNPRLFTISYLLETALDCEEEYLYEGEMSNYMRSYATDAASELDMLFRSVEPNPAELDYCVAAIAQPERIARGSSQKLLLQLRERSRPILQAFFQASDPQLRIFALKTAKTSVNPLCFMPLYGSIEMEQRLLNDPDENVRLTAIASTEQTMRHNAAYLLKHLQLNDENAIANLFHQLLILLEDPAVKVQRAVINALMTWAEAVNFTALVRFLERFLEQEVNPSVDEILAIIKNHSSNT